jgi:hypothetical protein
MKKEYENNFNNVLSSSSAESDFEEFIIDEDEFIL